MISLENIIKKYRSKIILQDICLKVQEGDSIALIGHNGCIYSLLIIFITQFIINKKRY